MTSRPRKPSEEQPAAAPQQQQQQQQMQGQVSQSFGESPPEVPEDDGTSFANINP